MWIARTLAAGGLMVSAACDDKESGAAAPRPAQPQATVRPAPEPLSEAALVRMGENQFRRLACFSCHSVDGTAATGPTVFGIYGKEVELADGRVMIRDDDYLRRAITAPQTQQIPGYAAPMPAYAHLREEWVEGLVAYIRSLGAPPDGAAEDIDE